MEKNENVSIISGSHNRDYDEITYAEAILDGDRIVGVRGISNQGIFSGCFWYDSDGIRVEKFCKDCKADICPDFFPCLLDYRDDVYCLYSNY